MGRKPKKTRTDLDANSRDYNIIGEIDKDIYEDFDCSADEIYTDDDIINIEQIDDSEIESLGYSTDPEQLSKIFYNYQNCTGYAKEKAAIQIEQQLKNLIYSIGHKHFSTYMDNEQEREELVSSAWCGVFSVADSYDPSRSAPSTFFYRPILHEMSEYINRFLNKSSSHSMNIRKKIKAATDRLVARGNKNPSVMDISYESGIRPCTIRKATDMEYYSRSRSLEDLAFDPSEYSSKGKSTKARDEYDATPAIDDFGNPFAVVAKKESYESLHRAIDSLPAQQADVLRRLFGVDCDRENYTDIFKSTGITTDVAKSLRQRALSCLRMNPELRQAWRGGLAQEIKEELNFEPISIVPDQAAFAMMSLLEEMEISDF